MIFFLLEYLPPLQGSKKKVDDESYWSDSFSEDGEKKTLPMKFAKREKKSNQNTKLS